MLNRSTLTPMIPEPLLSSEFKRNALFPIRYPDIWKFYTDHRASFWQPEEITLKDDQSHWEKLNADEKKYIKYVLAFFSGSDFIVNENCEADKEEVTILEYSFFNQFKIMMENIHSETYANLIEAFVRDSDEKEELLNAIETIPCIKRKADWCRRYINEGSFVTRLIAFAIVEGVFFSGSFCAIFWLKKRGLMPGLCQSNDFIARDEGLHRDFAIMVYRKYVVNKLPASQVLAIIREAVAIEQEFCCEALPVSLIGMNASQMAQYIEYVADMLSQDLINQKIYNSDNPFDWMLTIGMNKKDDFFSRRPTAYANQSVLASKADNEISFEADF